ARDLLEARAGWGQRRAGRRSGIRRLAADPGEDARRGDGHAMKVLRTLVGMLVGVALPALGADAPLKVGVTLHPYYSWTKNVVGETGVEVRPILPGEVDAGDYQPRPEDIQKIADLDA